jgi:hypothetical protein
MNLPSSLALPQSKLFQSRIGLIILLLVVALAGLGVFFFVLRPAGPPKTPTVATSPAATATPRPAMKQVVYGPPAPSWVPRAPMPAPASGVPGPATPLAASVTPPATTVPGAAAPAVPGTGASTVTGTGASTVPVALPLGAPAIPGGATLTAEVPKSLDASVLFARESYTYTSGKRRDPFASLLAGKFQTSGDGSLVDVGDIHLVGIMWGASDKFALVEDTRGRGFVLRVGDPVLNGYISGITKSEIQVVQSAFGESQTLAIQLKPKEGDKNATRQ